MELHKKIQEIKCSFQVIQDNYQKNKYKLERRDDAYKDSEENIFDDNSLWNLDQFILLEAQLYRDGSLRYDEILKIIRQLSEKIDNWVRSMRGRTMQGIPEAKKKYNSEKYYLKDMKIRLDYYCEILTLLYKLNEYEESFLKKGIELSYDDEYDAYLLNKCIMLSQVGYCRNECMRLIEDLNNRVGNSPMYNGDFYYKLAELNFALQRYKDAERFVDKTIYLLKCELAQNAPGEQRMFQLHDMLFSAYQLRVLGYEFCGDYANAVYYLTGKTPKEVISLFRRALNTHDFEALQYSSDNIGRFAEVVDKKRQAVVNNIESCIQMNIFSSEMAQYVYNSENREIFERIVEDKNKKCKELIRQKLSQEMGTVRAGYLESDFEKDVEKVYLANALDLEDANIKNEYIHILAHCINECGVTFMKRHNTDDEEELANNLVLLGRALMLYVSEKRAIYKSCYATTYAEAGDMWIARNELKRIIEHPDYAKYDVTTKAEIAFFYYIISSMTLIEDNEFNYTDEISNSLYNRYLNYCYRSFDYDAIAHIRVYSFRNKIAALLQSDDLTTMAKKFLFFSKQKVKERTAYQEFVDNVYFQNSNKRLINEYEKTKYMYQFLLSFFQVLTDNPNEQIVRSQQIIDYAFKYLHFYKASINNEVEKVIDYIDFINIEKDIATLSKLVNGVEYANNIVRSDHCRLIFLNNDNAITEFFEHVVLFNKEARSMMYFLACKDKDTLDKVKIGIKNRKVSIYPKFRVFDSLVAGLKEFIIFTTFFIIKDDFCNPRNIFVMTPIGTAKTCRYRIDNSVDLIDDFYAKTEALTVGSWKEVSTQYRAIAESMFRETAWESGLNNNRYGRYISYVVSVTYDRDSISGIVKYKYKYDVSDTWKIARLFSPSRWHQNMEDFYTALQYDSGKIPAHGTECAQVGAHCSVVYIENIDNSEYEGALTNFVDATKAFINIGDNYCRKALVWRGTNGSLVSWRLISLSENCPHNIINEIRQVMCCKGQGLVFAPIHAAFASKQYKWPNPHNYENSDKKFVFISHSSMDDDLVKQELNEFFVKYDVPIWYDKEKLIKDPTWKDRVRTVMTNGNCVGIVVLVTNSSFFKSEAIQFELSVASNIIKLAQKEFSVLPIVYGVAFSNLELRNLIVTSICDDDTAFEIKKMLIPDNNASVITYLRQNQSLEEYTRIEQGTDREGSVLAALQELKIKIKK